MACISSTADPTSPSRAHNHSEDQPGAPDAEDASGAGHASTWKQYAGPEQRYCPAGFMNSISTGFKPETSNQRAELRALLKTCDITAPTTNIVWLRLRRRRSELPDTCDHEDFADFYPFYLTRACQPHLPAAAFHRHLARPALPAACLRHAQFWWLLVGLVQGYAWAWVGHYFFEHNRPATFTHPFYSFLGDWVMWKEILTGKIKF
jgi:hypothetical protein